MKQHRTCARWIGGGALLVCLGGGVAPAAAAENATNGVYGGYVGSSAWFAAMRSSAANQAMLRSLSRGGPPGAVPAGYVEIAGRIVFPGGNPFPRQRIPDLRIRCRDQSADAIERAPYVDERGAFYTVFRRGQTYDLYWMGYFGGLEQFASVLVNTDGPAQRQVVIEYRRDAADGGSAAARTPGSWGTPTGSVSQPSAPTRSLARPPGADTFDLADFPRVPTTFEEQLIRESITSATTPPLKAQAHEKLAAYYERKGIAARARAERTKAEYWRSVTP